MHDALTHVFEDRLGFVERVLAATCHECERSGLGTADAARDRRIERQYFGSLSELMRGAGRCDINGG